MLGALRIQSTHNPSDCNLSLDEGVPQSQHGGRNRRNGHEKSPAAAEAMAGMRRFTKRTGEELAPISGD